MTLIAAIKAANNDGDFPASRDLADGLGRPFNSINACLTALKNAGKIEPYGKVPANHRGPHLKRWRVWA